MSETWKEQLALGGGGPWVRQTEAESKLAAATQRAERAEAVERQLKRLSLTAALDTIASLYDVRGTTWSWSGDPLPGPLADAHRENANVADAPPTTGDPNA